MIRLPSLLATASVAIGLLLALPTYAADNRITGLSLNAASAEKGRTVRVTVTGAGSCLVRIDNGGAETISGKTYTDVPDVFPKYLSLVVNGAAGTYTIKAKNANSRDTPCLGEASATLTVINPAAIRSAVKPATPPTTTTAPKASPTGGTTAKTAPVEGPPTGASPVARTTAPCKMSPREASGASCDRPSTAPPVTRMDTSTVSSVNPVIPSSSSAIGGMAPVAPVNQNAPLANPAPTGSWPNINTDTLMMAGSTPPDASVPTASSAKSTDKKPPEQHEPGQLIVLWDESAEAQDGLAILAREYFALPISRVDLSNLGGTLATFQFPDNKKAAALVAILRQKYPSWHVDLHARYLPLGGARIYLPSRVDAPQKLSASPNLRIGILDSTVAPIQALRDVRLKQRNFLSSTDKPALFEHGTSIAALIAGREQTNNFHGFAAGVQLYAGTIMRDQGGPEGSTNTAMLLRGLDWLVGERVRIINLSLGGPGNDLMASVFEKLQKRGFIVVAAAGNGGPEAQPSYPAAYHGVIAVTAVDGLDRPYADASRGSYIALAAPGVDVWTPDSEKGRYVTGTSFSAAVVTSAIGLMLSYRADLSVELVREHLCLGARDLGTPGHDPVYGCGLLQIGRTLARLKSSKSIAGQAKSSQ